MKISEIGPNTVKQRQRTPQQSCGASKALRIKIETGLLIYP